MRTIPFYIESANGHDEKLVPENNVVGEINKQVEDGKWVTVEKTDGSSEIVTDKISETNETSETPEKPKSDWQGLFGKPKTDFSKNLKDAKDITSATVTNKAKGG